MSQQQCTCRDYHLTFFNKYAILKKEKIKKGFGVDQNPTSFSCYLSAMLIASDLPGIQLISLFIAHT
jgi:hypothetical protein